MTAHLWKSANIVEAFAAPGSSSFIIQKHSNTNNFFHKRQKESLKSIMPGSCPWREGETFEALRAKRWEIKVGRGEGFLFLKDSNTKCGQILSALTLPLSASSKHSHSRVLQAS